MSAEQAKSEPAHQAELVEERKRREQLERRRQRTGGGEQAQPPVAAEAERSSAVRSELQRLGVSKIDLAYKAVQDGIVRTEDGRLVARSENGELPMKDYLAAFVSENPEFLPARIAGGSGMTASAESPGSGAGAGGPGADPSRNERGRDAAGARGNRARGIADPAGDVRAGIIPLQPM